jgi:hypothetical protein
MDNWLTVLTGYLNFSFKTWESWWLRMPRATLISMQGVFLFVITAQHWSIVDFAGSRLVLLASEFVCGIPGTGFSVKWISLMFRAWFVHSWLCKVSLYMQLNHNMCAWGQIHTTCLICSFMTLQSQSVYATQSLTYVHMRTNTYYVFNGFHNWFSCTWTSYVSSSSPLPGSNNNKQPTSPTSK